jgi:hypothetical protein
MAGKAGRSGRPKGSLSYLKNPTARCGHRLNVLIEQWLALAPERRFTVPPKIKASLAEQAIREELDMIGLDPENLEEVVIVDIKPVASPSLRPGWCRFSLHDVLAWSRRQAPKGPSLRRRVQGPDPDPYAQYVERLSNAWADKAAAQMDGAASVAALGAYATPVHK